MSTTNKYFNLVTVAGNNATNIQDGDTRVLSITAGNTNAAARYLKFYNTVNIPNPATDTPVLTFIIPGGSAGAGTNIPVPSGGDQLGFEFSLGLSIAVVAGISGNDNTSVLATDVVVNIVYR